MEAYPHRKSLNYKGKDPEKKQGNYKTTRN